MESSLIKENGKSKASLFEWLSKKKKKKREWFLICDLVLACVCLPSTCKGIT